MAKVKVSSPPTRRRPNTVAARRSAAAALKASVLPRPASTMRDASTPAGANSSRLWPGWPLKRLMARARLTAPAVASSAAAAAAVSAPPSRMPTTNAPGPMPRRDAKEMSINGVAPKIRLRHEISDTVASDALFLVPDSSFLLAESDAKPVLLRLAPDRWAIPAVYAASDACGVDDPVAASPRPRDQSRAVGRHLRLSHLADAAEPAGGDRADRVFRGDALRAQQA